MNKASIYVRTAKGAREFSTGSHQLARDLRIILSAIDGQSSVAVLRGKFDSMSAAELDEALATLVVEDFIRDSAPSIPGLVSSSQGLAGDAGGEQADASAPMPPDRASQPAAVKGDESARRAQALRAKIRDRRQGTDRRSPLEGQYSGTERRATAEARQMGAEERRSTPEPGPGQQQTGDQEQTRRLAEEQARHEAEAAEAQARREAEAAADRAAAERARQEAEALARRVAEDRARRDAEDDVRRRAEELAKREAEERARQEAEVRVRREVEEQIRLHAEEEARREAAEKVRQEAAAQTRRVAAEQARQDAEATARWMAEQQASRETEEKLRAEGEAAARKRANAREADTAGSRQQVKRGQALALGLAALLAVALVTAHLISFDGQLLAFERSLAGQFQQPVKIGALRFSLVPQPHLRLEGVSIGNDGQISVPRIKATGELGKLFSDRKVFQSIELDSPLVSEEGLGWILFGKPLGSNMEFGRASALNVKLESKNVRWPAFDATLQPDGKGGWKAIAIESVDKNLSLELTSKDNSAQFDFKAKTFKIPFGSALTLEELVATGTADSSGLVVTDFKGFAYGGILSGNARLTWGQRWYLAGELNAKQIDMSRLVPGLLDDARLAGTAAYAMEAADAAKLFVVPHLEGNFMIPRGTLLGVDLVRLLQGGGMRGDTKFADLTGSLVHDRGATQLRQVRLAQGPMSASGTVDIDADQSVRGRVVAEVKLSTEQLRAKLAVAGTVSKLEFSRK